MAAIMDAWNATGLPMLFEGKRNPFYQDPGCMPTLSNTVCIADPDGEWLSVQERVVEELSEFGEIARVDTSLAILLKCMLVTYFDVRCAQQVLLQLAGRTEPFPPAAHDCRMVRVNMAAFAEKVGSLSGFHQFGEVMNISMIGASAIVEFYDMRSAQFLLATAGNTASPWTPEMAQQNSVAAPLPAPLPPMQMGMGYMATLAALSAQPHTAAPQVDAVLSHLSATAQAGGFKKEEAAPRFGAVNGSAAKGADAADDKSKAVSNFVQAGLDSRIGNRPLRTKVTTKEFSKYDIDAGKIQRGEDTRTTVMVRNLAGPRARKDFLSFLEKCGLHEKYTFFYMPCKEHRNVPAGFAFVNFAAPMDVLALHMKVKSGLWTEFTNDPQAKHPAMSYARFQGHEELAKHFSSSAVLHEQDPEKRPIFRVDDVPAKGPSQYAEYNQDGGTGGPIGSPKPSLSRDDSGNLAGEYTSMPSQGRTAQEDLLLMRGQGVQAAGPYVETGAPAYISTASIRNAARVAGAPGKADQLLMPKDMPCDRDMRCLHMGA